MSYYLHKLIAFRKLVTNDLLPFVMLSFLVTVPDQTQMQISSQSMTFVTYVQLSVAGVLGKHIFLYIYKLYLRKTHASIYLFYQIQKLFLPIVVLSQIKYISF